MPTEWKYHADGVDTAVRTAHELDGTLTSVRLQIDSFRTRDWMEHESDDADRELFEGEREGEYTEYADGSHATLRFRVEGREAVLRSLKPEDVDGVEPRHLALLAAAERVLQRLDGVDSVADPMETIAEPYHSARNIHIDALDA